MSATPQSPDTTFWSAVGELAAAAVTVVGALWIAALTVLRPLFESLTMRAIRAKRSELGEFLRSEVLKRDLDAGETTEKQVQRLLLMAESNARTIEEIAERHAVLDRELRALPALAQSLETCTHAVETLSRDVGTLSGKIERYGGMFEQAQRDQA